MIRLFHGSLPTEKVMSVPTLEEAYRKHRGLLFRALGRLADRGIAAPPDEAIDLIHDFFLEAWHGLARRYDPRQARFTTYLYAAFVHFARPRILRLSQSRRLRDEVACLAALQAPDPDSRTSERERQAVNAALAALPRSQREALVRYISMEPPSERRLAGEMSMSRYRLRLSLVDALGRIASVLGRPKGAPAGDWVVAVALWHQGRSVTETAAQLGLTPDDVTAAQERNRRVLAACLRAMRSGRPRKEDRRWR